MGFEFKPLEEEDWSGLVQVLKSSFGWAKPDSAFDNIRPVYEFDRSLAAYEGASLAANIGVWSLDKLSIPGGMLPASGLSLCAVSPCYQGGGLFRQMMSRQLQDMRDRGEALTILFAEEGGIYDRYGYGPATYGAVLKLQRHHAEFRASPPADSGRLRLVSREQAIAAWGRVDDCVMKHRPGVNNKRSVQWAMEPLIFGQGGDDLSERFYLQFEGDDGIQGYVFYQIGYSRAFGVTSSKLYIDGLMATTPMAYTALWRYFFELSLIDEIQAARRPVEEPVLWMLADPQRINRQVYNMMWVRLLDVVKALEARSYLCESRIIIELTGEEKKGDRRVYELDASPDGARCAVSNKTPDVHMSIAELSALYMGGVSAGMLHEAGRLDGNREAVMRLDHIFRSEVAPWSPRTF